MTGAPIAEAITIVVLLLIFCWTVCELVYYKIYGKEQVHDNQKDD